MTWLYIRIDSHSPSLFFVLSCSHHFRVESKIPEKIEVSLGSGIEHDNSSSFQECGSISHLGYISLQSNERSDFQARELKSIPIERPATFIQLVLIGCHKNVLSAHNQVGIAGVRVLGMVSTVAEENVLGEEEDVAAVVTHSERSTKASSPMNTIRSATNNLPTKIEIPPDITPVATLPAHVKQELDPKMQGSVDRLERLKKDYARREDFETAFQIKEALGTVYALLISYKDCQSKMKQAAKEEDYSLASCLKSERDLKRGAATQALSDVEARFISISSRLEDVVGDLSISTIKDDSFVSRRSKHQLSPTKSLHSGRSILSHHEESEPSDEESCTSDSNSCGEAQHPLEGVENAEELPAPENITDASPDLVGKVEDLFGSYRAKCFFSKNWLLREAALTKMTLMAPDVCGNSSGDCAEALCNIIEMGIDDKNVQVYLASLILLDETVLQLEDCKLPQSKVTPMVSRIVLNLLSKLADSKPKVSDSSELALLSLASSPCIDKASIVNLGTKRIRSKDSKGGRSVKARLNLLENLAAEFGDGVNGKRVVEFTKGHKTFEHKDGGVRDAAKSLIVTLMVVHGEEAILNSLEDCDQVNDRQLKEFRSRLRMIKEG